MTYPKLWLAFDIGTTGTKAALLTPDGRVIASAYREYLTHTDEGGVVEQNANDWYQAVVDSARELSSRSDFQSVDAIALTGQMQNVILIDQQGNPTAPVILYSDTRAQREIEQVIERIGVGRLWEITGNDQGASSLLAKLLWLELHNRTALESAAYLLFGAADFIAFKLTSAVLTDTTTASTTGLMDIRSRTALSDEDFQQLGIAWSKLLPPMKAGGEQSGVLTKESAAVLGARAGIPVYHGPGDAGATTLGAGSGEAGYVYGYLGTSGWVGFTAGNVAPPQSVFTLAHPQENRYIHVAPLLTAGGNLDWVRDLFDSEDYEQLTTEGFARSPSNMLYLPYLNGERSPFNDPLARGAFIGLSPRTEKGDLYRAVLEGVVFAYRHALDTLMESAPKSLMLTGGGTRSLAWCQLFADILNVPVNVSGDKEFVGVRGAVLAAQVMLGEYDNYAPTDYFPVAHMLQPNQLYRDHFDRQYGIFRDTYLALKPIYARLATS